MLDQNTPEARSEYLLPRIKLILINCHVLLPALGDGWEKGVAVEFR